MPRTKEQFKEMREITMKNIIDSSLKLFAEKGFNGTTISDIANNANISKGLIYNYFKSKKEIVEAIYNSLISELEIIMESIRILKEPSEKLRRIILDTINLTRKNMDYWKLYVSFILQPSLMEQEGIYTPEYFQKFFNEFENIFIDAEVKNPKFEAYEFAAILDGLQFHILFMDNLYPLNEMQEYLLKKYSKSELLKRCK